MFRSDRDALAQQVEDMRHEQAELRAQNDAMRRDLLAHRQQVPEAHRGIGVHGSVYKMDIAQVTAGDRAALAHHELEAFPVWAMLALHVLTFGVSSFFHFSLMHGKLPTAERDDPSVPKALGFAFIPYFNIYWLFFSPLRLADRLNLQLRLRGLPDQVPRGLILASSVLALIPWLGWAAGLFVWPIALAYLQRAANTLAALPRDGSDVAAVAAGEQEGARRRAALAARLPTPRMRVPLVRDLPGPDDIVEQQQAELEADQATRPPAPRDVVR